MKAYIVWVQRYPSDEPKPVAFTSEAKADSYLEAKLEDYRYTTGRAWKDKK